MVNTEMGIVFFLVHVPSSETGVGGTIGMTFPLKEYTRLQKSYDLPNPSSRETLSLSEYERISSLLEAQKEEGDF